MHDPDTPDLFAAAGIELEEDAPKNGGISQPKRPRKPKPPTPAKRAAADRLEGGRRPKRPTSQSQRIRIGQPRRLCSAPVLAFPLHRNAKVLSQTVQALPHFYDEAFEKKWKKVGRIMEQRLIKRGLKPHDALDCAYELLDAALDIRATQAEAERSVR